jgi:hypothetical protein
VALEHIDPLTYLQENPDAIGEMINYSSETPVIGKYVLGFFESFLMKLKTAVGSQ